MLNDVVAVLAGAVAGWFAGRAGQAAAVDSRIAPLRASLSEMADKFDHATRRWRKRDADAAPDETALPFDNRRRASVMERWLRTRGNA